MVRPVELVGADGGIELVGARKVRGNESTGPAMRIRISGGQNAAFAVAALNELARSLRG